MHHVRLERAQRAYVGEGPSHVSAAASHPKRDDRDACVLQQGVRSCIAGQNNHAHLHPSLREVRGKLRDLDLRAPQAEPSDYERDPHGVSAS